MICAFILLYAMKIAATNAHPSVHDTDLNSTKSAPKLDWWENGVFYQIYPRSFKDSNSDGIGDICGIIEKLDYLKELGVIGVWLSPIFKSPMKDFGYDIEDFKQIDLMFGTEKELRELFKIANEKGIKIILDFVPNHSSDECEWFIKSVQNVEPYRDYYIWNEGKKDENGDLSKDANGKNIPPNNWVSVYRGSAWTWNDARKAFYYHQFGKEQPDLNYRNPKVVVEMKSVLSFWLDRGASGFRLDAVNHLFEIQNVNSMDEPLSGLDDYNSYDYTKHIYTRDLKESYEMIYQLREFLDDYQKTKGGPTRILMTEAYTTLSEYPKYIASTDGNHKGSQMPFNFLLIEKVNENSRADQIKQIIDEKIKSVPKGTRLNWVIGNHDQPRAASRYGDGKVDAFLTLVLTLPGIAVTYNGEEIGMLDNRNGISYSETKDPQACNLKENENWKEKSRDPERTPFQWDDSKWAGFTHKKEGPWLPVHSNYHDLNLAVQRMSKRSTFKFYKDLVKLRENPTFLHGSFYSKVVNENVFAYVRALEGHDTMVVLINFGIREETINVNGITNDFGEQCEIVVAGADTIYNAGDKRPTNALKLRKYNSVIIKKVQSSATGSVPSFIVLIAVSIAHFV